MSTTTTDMVRSACRNRLLNHLRRVGAISLDWAAVRVLAGELRMDATEAERAIDESVRSGRARVEGKYLYLAGGEVVV